MGVRQNYSKSFPIPIKPDSYQIQLITIESILSMCKSNPNLFQTSKGTDVKHFLWKQSLRSNIYCKMAKLLNMSL